jgi:uncharacterized protein
MVDAPGATLAILTRAPSSGGKSRLFQALGMEADAELLRSLLLDTLDGTRLPGLHRVIAVTPGSACDEVRQIVETSDLTDVTRGASLVRLASRTQQGSRHNNMRASLAVMPQVGGDLGARMQSVMAALFARGATSIVLVGSDLPHIVPDTIAHAFDVLARDRGALVIGPAGDGGYYLIGACRVPDVFTGVEWGSRDVLARTIDAAVNDGLRVHQLPVLSDVDTVADLRAAVRSGRAARTAAWMRGHLPHLM